MFMRRDPLNVCLLAFLVLLVVNHRRWLHVSLLARGGEWGGLCGLEL